MPDVFRSRGLALGTDMSGFRMFAGNSAFQYGSTADFTNLSTVDAPQHTMLIFETMPQNAENWTEPDEIPFNPANPLAGLTLAPDFFLAATADKEVKQINPSVAPQTFAAFATWDGHEILSTRSTPTCMSIGMRPTTPRLAPKSSRPSIRRSRASRTRTTTCRPVTECRRAGSIPRRACPISAGGSTFSPSWDTRDLFNQFHLDEPWNGPDNLPLLSDMPQEFRSRGLSPGTTLSAFKLIVGPDAYTVTTSDGFANGPRTIDVFDGVWTTINVVELMPDQAVPWTEWSDIQYSATNPLAGFGTIPSDGLRVVMWDGSVHTISPDTTAANLGIFETYNQGELITPAIADNVFTDWPLADTTANNAAKLSLIMVAMRNYYDVNFSYPLPTGAARIGIRPPASPTSVGACICSRTSATGRSSTSSNSTSLGIAPPTSRC